MKLKRIILSVLCLTVLACEGQKKNNSESQKQDPVKNINNKTMAVDTATFGAGCFWCVEAVFQRLKGVDTVVSGYTGGKISNPTYREVCSGLTGHAEVIQVIFDPEVISFEQLVEVFFYVHDPTTLNRQGADEGTQYRSAIFYQDEVQKVSALKVKEKLNKEVFENKIVTEITAISKFYPAEDYHQNYYNLNGSQPYCRIVISPKIGKFSDKFKHLLK